MVQDLRVAIFVEEAGLLVRRCLGATYRLEDAADDDARRAQASLLTRDLHSLERASANLGLPEIASAAATLGERMRELPCGTAPSDDLVEELLATLFALNRVISGLLVTTYP